MKRREFLSRAARSTTGALVGVGVGAATATQALAAVQPARHGGDGALRPRVLVSTDIGGTDFDDFQSMVHLLLYADRLEIAGLVSSPFGAGRVEDILRVVDAYERDYGNLRTYSPHYPSPARLRALSKQGARESAGSRGFGEPTEGSRWIVKCAREGDDLLNVLVWGGIDDLAQALHDAPDILPKLRVYYIGGPNKLWAVDAYNYIETHHPELRIIESDATYRGFFTGGDQSGEWGNAAFVERHVAGHGALGDFFATQSPQVKMGDTPSVTWLLQGSQNPALPSWGGQYVRVWDGRKTVFDRLTTAADTAEVYGVVEFAIPAPESYGPGNTARMVIDNRTSGPFPVAVNEGSVLRFRFSPRDPKVWPYVIQSDHPALDGLSGAVTAAPPPAERASTPSSSHPYWWTDDQDPAAAEGPWAGAKHVSRWRLEYLSDFSARLDRCKAPAPC
ncbi:DUF1593 domain-containing protein [Actinacidiphila bryophytorum]|nr:DUF1593 domain-containing protein [Actinacidiphila bryophytorum]MBM9439700.1 DUF1593 domain-containing protein [Actinacidiphila bryophytorum]MBN6548002.1 DUF1593 domain-containing protein [Actinacidiphila bryophytorum]